MIFHCGWTDAELVFTCRQLQLRPAPLHQPTSCVFHLSANQLLVCSRLQHLHLRAQWFPWQCQMTAYSYHSYTSGHGSNHSCHYHGNCRGLTVGTMVDRRAATMVTMRDSRGHSSYQGYPEGRGRHHGNREGPTVGGQHGDPVTCWWTEWGAVAVVTVDD